MQYCEASRILDGVYSKVLRKMVEFGLFRKILDRKYLKGSIKKSENSVKFTSTEVAARFSHSYDLNFVITMCSLLKSISDEL